MVQLMKGVYITPLKIIELDKGNVFHALKNTDETFHEFGEAYFSTVNFGCFKGWKLHQQMVLNIVVPVGAIQFYFVQQDLDSKKTETASVILSPRNYNRLTVEPGVWVGFKGMDKGINLLLNIGSIPHDPAEALNEQPETWLNYFE